MTEAVARLPARNVDLAYETFGDRRDSPVVLVMGLGTQMIAWPDEMCAQIAGCGHLVVRFDNRDVGRSSHLAHLGVPRLRDLVLHRPPYRLNDLADDVAALLDVLDLPSVHLVGASMGGYVAQEVVLRHPERVRSLALLMTSTGSRLVGGPKPGVALRLFTRPAPRDRQGVADLAVDTFRRIGSPGYPFDEQRIRSLAERSFDRGHDRAGQLRQLGAILAQPNRSRRLRAVRAPTVVVHGLRDPLVAPSGGRALARQIPGARFVGVPGMGHDLPREVWPRLADEVCRLAARADARQASRAVGD